MKKIKQAEEIMCCNCCGAKLNGRWENISKGIAENLIKFRVKVLSKRVNKVHLMKDLNLTHSQYTNFQKLRFHGLIAHYTNPITKEEECGNWLLTKRGNQFCKNQISIPKKVLIFRNTIQEKGDSLINISQILSNKNNEPYWYEKHDYENEIVFVDILDAKEPETSKFIQGKLF